MKKYILYALILCGLALAVFVAISTTKINKGKVTSFVAAAYSSPFVHFKGTENDYGETAYYDYINVPDSIGTIVAIGGTGGGFDGPSLLYYDFEKNLPAFKLSLLRVHVSPPQERGARQVLAALKVLKAHNNTKPIILIGWSMGGASIISVAKELVERKDELVVKSLISLAGQTAGASPISRINTKIHILHGDKDPILNVACAYTIRKWAKNLGEFIIVKDVGHGFEQNTKELYDSVYNIIFKDFNVTDISL